MESIDVYLRNGNSLEDDDTWDDKLLIEAYNKSVRRIKKTISEQLGVVNGDVENHAEEVIVKKELGEAVSKFKWQVGDCCRAMYSEDGKDYEAKIIELLPEGLCIVKYFGYENEEVVNLNDLKKTLGNRMRAEQTMAAKRDQKNENADGVESFRVTSNGVLDNGQTEWSPSRAIPPPPAPHMLSQIVKSGTESDALSAMLMSWYMSGYHTGYYQGLMESKNQMRRLPKKEG